MNHLEGSPMRPFTESTVPRINRAALTLTLIFVAFLFSDHLLGSVKDVIRMSNQDYLRVVSWTR